MRLSSVFPALFPLFLFIDGVMARSMWTGQQGPSAGKPAASSRPAPVQERLPEVGQSLERDLKEGETHVFTTRIGAGQYLEVTVDQLGIDASVEIADELGKSVMKIDTPTAAEERETVGLVAVRAGTYSVTIRPVIQPTSPKEGRYRLTVTARRAATARDRSLDKGLRALSGALAEKDAAKALRQAELAYEALLPLLGPSHPNVRAAALAYARKAPKDKWLRAAQLAEPILAAREKDDSARPAELLDWNGIILRGYSNAPGDQEANCKYRETILPLFLREIRLRDQVFGHDDSETRNVFAALAAFHRRCDPDKFPDFIETIIAERGALLGESHSSIADLLRIYGQSLTPRTLERFSAFLDRRTETALADPHSDRQTKALALIQEALIRSNLAFKPLPLVEEDGTSASDDRPSGSEDAFRTQELKAVTRYRQAMELMESEKGKFQWQYLLCLDEIRRIDETQLPDYDDRVLAFAESIKRLKTPEVLTRLGGVAGGLEVKIDPLIRGACSQNTRETAQAKEKIRRVYEEIFRLAESQFSVDSESDTDGSVGFRVPPGQLEKTKPEQVAFLTQYGRKEIDSESLAYAGFLFSFGEHSAASDVLERGLAFHLKHDSDSIDALIFFAAGFDLAGNEKRAAELYGELLTLAESVEDKNSRNIKLFRCLPAIAQFQERYGRYDEAESIYLRLGEITERLHPKPGGGAANQESEPDQVNFSIAEQGLAWISAVRGDEKAFAERLLVLHQKFPYFAPEGSNDQSWLRSPAQWREKLLVFYASQYAQFGNYERASALIDRLGKDPVDESVSSIAGLTLMRMGRTREAVAYFERSVLARATTDPIGAGKRLRWLLTFEEEFNPPKVVLTFLERVGTQLEKRPDSKRERMFLLSQIGRFQMLAGQPDEALGTYQRLTEMGQGVTGVPIQVQERIALELWRSGRDAAAIRQQIAVNDLREFQLIQMALEKIVPWPKFAFLNPPPWFNECIPELSAESDIGFSAELNRTVSLQISAFSDLAIARRAALESALRRKGRTPEAFVDSVTPRRFERQFLGEGVGLIREVAQLEFKTIPRTAEVTWQLFLEFGGLGSSDFSRWCLRTNRTDGLRFELPIENYSRVKKDVTYTAAVTSLASQIIEQNPEYRLLLTPVTVEAVQKALPADGALVEVVRYAPFNPKTGTTEGEERYAVYVLTPQGEPKWFDGGTVSEIDRATILLANEARDYADDESKAATAVLENRFITPALKLTGNAKRVYVAFDEQLASLPLKKLVDAEGKSFGESRGLIFIRNGRELLNSVNTR